MCFDQCNGVRFSSWLHCLSAYLPCSVLCSIPCPDYYDRRAQSLNIKFFANYFSMYTIRVKEPLRLWGNAILCLAQMSEFDLDPDAIHVNTCPEAWSVNLAG